MIASNIAYAIYRLIGTVYSSFLVSYGSKVRNATTASNRRYMCSYIQQTVHLGMKIPDST